MREKVMGLREAAALIKDGDTVAIGGHTLRRHPMALIHEIVRQGRRGLRLQGWNNGIDMDMLIGAGCAASVETSYIGISAFGLAWNFRRACEGGGLRVIEHSETTGLDMFRRGMMDWGFVSGAQIDPYGNLNSVCIGDQKRPRVRLVGPIAQTDHCAHARHTIGGGKERCVR